MKKTYKTPLLRTSVLMEEQMIAFSAQTNDTPAQKDGDGNYNNDVKLGGSYNVWNDDWSE